MSNLKVSLRYIYSIENCCATLLYRYLEILWRSKSDNHLAQRYTVRESGLNQVVLVEVDEKGNKQKGKPLKSHLILSSLTWDHTLRGLLPEHSSERIAKGL